MSGQMQTNSGFLNGWRVAGWSVLAALLTLPAIAMQFTREVDWSGSDFVIMGVMLTMLGLAMEGVMRIARTGRSRMILAALALGTFLLVWAELAVGVFGTPWAGS